MRVSRIARSKETDRGKSAAAKAAVAAACATALLERNSEAVPKMENVTERLLHEERKMKEKGAV